jgi:hypothetical protein
MHLRLRVADPAAVVAVHLNDDRAVMVKPGRDVIGGRSV